MIEYSIPNELKITLAAARVNVGLTQDAVANEMHVSKSTIVSWEKGRTSPTVTQADRLYELYKRPKDSIIFRIEVN
ncbi:MAG: helix-turn-helix domain-containing protein [Lachnospiraceae bacterium]|nr:helix-turn-helix domain-containing protein [Lachnospiraceae bacterium]